MKIQISLLLTLLFSCSPVLSVDHIPETKEIIGSGIFAVNKTRKFSIDENTIIYLDDTEIGYTVFEIIGSGFKSAFTLIDDVNNTIDSGTINAIELITNIKGPVTSMFPLMVLEQPVLTTSDTVMTVHQQVIGDSVAVSGYLSGNNSLKATKIMANNNLDDWKVRGYARDITASNFKIGTLQINLGGEQILNCNKGFNNGVLVEVKMMADPTYQVGMPINTILSIECLKLNQLAEEISILPSVVQGFVSQTQGHDFWLNDINVDTDNNTIYENGERGFIDDAVNVEVQGTMDTQTSVLQADVVRFLDHRVEVTFPVEPQDIIIDHSITIQGTTFLKTPQTKDNANILSAGIVAGKQIQIQGYIDSNGAAYISKTLNKGATNFNHVTLRGDIASLANPFFSILNFQIDASNSLIINQGSGVIDINTFFNLVEAGSQVEIKNAEFDTGLNQVVNGQIFIKKIVSASQIESNKEIIGSGIISGFGTATITETPDQLFVSGFEFNK